MPVLNTKIQKHFQRTYSLIALKRILRGNYDIICNQVLKCAECDSIAQILLYNHVTHTHIHTHLQYKVSYYFLG